MDPSRRDWYFSGMSGKNPIPSYALYGETQNFPDVVHAERISDRAADVPWHITPHRHRDLAQLLHIEAGAASAGVDGQTVQLCANDFLYLPAQIVHSFEFQPGSDGSVLSFPAPILKSLGPPQSSIGVNLAHPVHGATSADLAALLQNFSTTYQKSSRFRRQRLVGLTQALLAVVAEGHRVHGPRPPTTRIAELDQQLAEHLTDNWRPHDYAAALMITQGQLNRICKKAAGLNAQSYIERAVMLEACRLLAFTGMSVAQVGYRLGFADPSYFSRRFHKRQGTSPSTYRARFLS